MCKAYDILQAQTDYRNALAIGIDTVGNASTVKGDAIVKEGSNIHWRTAAARRRLVLERNSHARDRRPSRPFGLHLSMRYRRLEKFVKHGWSEGVTRHISRNLVVFNGAQGGQALPVGSLVELRIDWPVRQAAERAIDLHAGGFVLWVAGDETAVRISSYRFPVDHVADDRFPDEPGRPG